MTAPLRMAPETSAGSGAGLSGAGLHTLLAWTSPSFPVGAYTYSHGLEWAVEDGTVRDAATLRAWVTGVLRHGAGWSDTLLLVHGLRAAALGEEAAFRELLDLSLALQPSSERRLEASAQGDAFIAAIIGAWPPSGDTAATRLFARLTKGEAALARGEWAYALAFSAAAAAWGLPEGPVATAFLHAFAANLVSAAVRAVPLGQTDGQRVVNALGDEIVTLAAAALQAPLEEIGGCAFAADIASMKHETQYTRLFRS